MEKTKKILLICLISQTVITFRKKLIEKLINEGYSVSVITFDDEYGEEIKKLGATFYCINDCNRSMNPFKILTLKNKYRKIIREVKPDKVFTFMLKPNTFGVMATKKEGVKDIYSMVEGAGDAFSGSGLKWKIVKKVVCFLYRRSFKFVKNVFFLNNDDKAQFLSEKLVNEDKCEIVRGIGVDLDYFSFKEIKTQNTFLMISRMVKLKGVYEFFECAKIVKEKYPQATFNFLGAESEVTLKDLSSYIDGGIVNYLGTTKDVRPYIEDCSVYMLPSYREGLPMSVMEAEAMGRAVITSDNIGCKDSIEDGYNGFLVKNNDVNIMAEKAIYFIENPQAVIDMGKKSRKYAEDNFDSEIINKKILEVISR